MKFSKETETLIEEINEYSSSPLRNRFEVTVLIESAVCMENKTSFKDLIFTAKYVNGLKSVLSNRIVTGDEFMEKMFDEFNKNLQKFINLLKTCTNSSDEKTAAHFEEKYFQLDQKSIVNSMELIEDLSKCKEFFNSNPKDFIA